MQLQQQLVRATKSMTQGATDTEKGQKMKVMEDTMSHLVAQNEALRVQVMAITNGMERSRK